MVGTMIMISIALIIVIPLGIAAAVFLNEIPGRFTRFVRIVVEAMTALPSIIAGLFIYATFILILGFDKSGLAAALAISVMMLPIIIRASDVVLRLVPGNLKEASYALGASPGAHGVARDAADRAVGPGHRRDPGHRARDRRDLTGPAHRRVHRVAEHESARRADGQPPAGGLRLHQVARGELQAPRASPPPRCC